MNKYLFDQIWNAQELLAGDPQYEDLLKEYRTRNAVLLAQLETMTALQRNAVMDYLGVLTELHLKMLLYSIDNN